MFSLIIPAGGDHSEASVYLFNFSAGSKQSIHRLYGDLNEGINTMSILGLQLTS